MKLLAGTSLQKCKSPTDEFCIIVTLFRLQISDNSTNGFHHFLVLPLLSLSLSLSPLLLSCRFTSVVLYSVVAVLHFTLASYYK